MIPEEVFLIPFICLFLALITPLTTVPLVYFIINKITGKSKEPKRFTSLISIVGLFMPLLFLYNIRFQWEVSDSVMLCFTMSVFFTVLRYFLSEN